MARSREVQHFGRNYEQRRMREMEICDSICDQGGRKKCRSEIGSVMTDSLKKKCEQEGGEIPHNDKICEQGGGE